MNGGESAPAVSSGSNPGIRNAASAPAPGRGEFRHIGAFPGGQRTLGARIARYRISTLVVVISLFLVTVSGQAACADTHATEALDRGVEAFRAGNYNAALRSFLDARQAGLDTPVCLR